jgi:hypothetical protein
MMPAFSKSSDIFSVSLSCAQLHRFVRLLRCIVLPMPHVTARRCYPPSLLQHKLALANLHYTPDLHVALVLVTHLMGKVTTTSRQYLSLPDHVVGLPSRIRLLHARS